MNAIVSQDIRGVLITVARGSLLLPNASLAEVITYSDPDPVPNAPAWLLGRARWRGWALPIVSYSRLVGWSNEAPALGAKVAVLKTVGNHARMPYFAMLTQGFPRLVTIAANALTTSGRGGDLPVGIFAEAMFNDDEVVVPDLAAIEAQIVEVLQEAPKTAA